MERRRTTTTAKGLVSSSSPSHSISSSSSSSPSASDFEFTISFSPRKASVNLCPADELFYKGQILPLHLSPRLSMVRTLTTSTSFSDTTNTDSRDSTGSSNSSTDSNNSSISTELLLLAAECESSRPSSSTNEDGDLMKRVLIKNRDGNAQNQNQMKKLKYFSLSRFSSVFKKDGQPVSNNKNRDYDQPQTSASTDQFSMKKRMSNSAKEMIRKYLRKVKPLYEKLSQKQQQKIWASSESSSEALISDQRSAKNNNGEILLSSSSRSNSRKEKNGMFSHSFSGNLRYPRRRRRSCVSSCPSSMRSSPSHSGVLCRNSVVGGSSSSNSYNNKLDCSSMEELQNAIQGAIAHCKNSMMREEEGEK